MSQIYSGGLSVFMIAI